MDYLEWLQSDAANFAQQMKYSIQITDLDGTDEGWREPGNRPDLARIRGHAFELRRYNPDRGPTSRYYDVPDPIVEPDIEE